MEIKRFRGLRNVESAEQLKPGDLATALNVDLTNAGKIMSRKGYTRVSATAVHSLYSNHAVALAASGTSLKRLAGDFSLVQLAELGSGRPVSYETLVDSVFYSNGVTSGIVQGQTWRPWGVAVPSGQPAAERIPGTMPPGRYQYAMTYRRGDGHESGTGASGEFELTSAGGIRFTGMETSTNSGVRDKILYLSGPNGETLYRAAEVPNAQVSADVAQGGYGAVLLTQFASPPPPGHIVRYHGGSMWVATADGIYYSDPYEPELFRLADCYMRVAGMPSMMEPVGSGMFVATEDEGSGDDSETKGQTWYWSGSNPRTMSPVQIFDHGAVMGTAVRVDAGFLESPVEGETEGMNSRPAVLWVSRLGVCAGFEGGAARNYTEARYSFPVAQRGAGMIRQDRGYTSYVVTLQGTGAANNAYA